MSALWGPDNLVVGTPQHRRSSSSALVPLPATRVIPEDPFANCRCSSGSLLESLNSAANYGFEKSARSAWGRLLRAC